MHVLVVEDDAVVRRSVKQGLEEAGYGCSVAGDVATGLILLRDVRPDLIVLDMMLPDASGADLLKQMRDRSDATPVIILTARGAIEDRVSGLTAGADDYLVKPFVFVELLARIEAVRRRTMLKPATLLEAAGISLDLTNRRVTRKDRIMDLTPTEFTLLELLLRFSGHVVTRQMLCEHVWGFYWEGNTNVIEVHVNRLRQKLDRDENGASCIQTVRGRGYAISS